MREILYRGKSLESNEWVYGGIGINKELLEAVIVTSISIPSPGEEDVGAMDSEFINIYVDVDTISQYTFVTDMNDCMIFEGDIIEFKSYFVNKRWWSSIEEIKVIEKECEDQRQKILLSCNVVSLDSGTFKLDYPLTLRDVSLNNRLVKGQSYTHDTEERQWDFEVIGNIYDNKELLNKHYE